MFFETKEKEKLYYEQLATEQEFLEWYKTLDLPTYEKPSLTVDNVILAYDREVDDVKLLMIKRKAHPFKDHYALAGGFVDSNESTEKAVLREVHEELGLSLNENQIEQLYTFSTPLRDPRAWVVSVAYLTFLPELPKVVAGDDAESFAWFSINYQKETSSFTLRNDSTNEVIALKDGKEVSTSSVFLAFDHAEIIFKALERIQGSLNWKPKVLEILGGTFTLTEVRKVFSKFLPVTSYKEIDNSNLKKTHSHLFNELGTTIKSVGRPPKLYSLKK